MKRLEQRRIDRRGILVVHACPSIVSQWHEFRRERSMAERIHSLTLQVPFPEIAVDVVRQTRFTEEQDGSKEKGKT